MRVPEGLAHRGWLGVVTGIRLIRIIAAAERHGGFLDAFYSRYIDSSRGGRDGDEIVA